MGVRLLILGLTPINLLLSLSLFSKNKVFSGFRLMVFVTFFLLIGNKKTFFDNETYVKTKNLRRIQVVYPKILCGLYKQSFDEVIKHRSYMWIQRHPIRIRIL